MGRYTGSIDNAVVLSREQSVQVWTKFYLSTFFSILVSFSTWSWVVSWELDMMGWFLSLQGWRGDGDSTGV